VEIQDTKMHTNLEIIHIMKFDMFVKGSYLDWVCKFHAFGEGPYLDQIYRIWSSSHHINVWKWIICHITIHTNAHYAPKKAYPWGGLNVWFKV
jgi:hypothetical protein